MTYFQSRSECRALTLLVVCALLAVACTSGEKDPGPSDAVPSASSTNSLPTSSTSSVDGSAPGEASGSETTETTDPPLSTDPNPSPDALATVLSGWLGDGPGGAVMAKRAGGELTLAAAGVADADGTPMTVDARFRVGGLTKTVIAALVMLEVEDGTIGLDEPLFTYLPELAGETGITVRQLLEERSGLADFTRGALYNESVFTERSRVWTADEVLSLVAAIPPSSAPGATYAYSNANYVTLGLMLETVLEADLNRLLADRITGPLSMSDTFLAGIDEGADDTVEGFSPAVGGWVGEPYTSISTSLGAAGALVSTAADVATFYEALLDGELVSESSLDAMTETMDDGFGMSLFPVAFPQGDGYAQSGAIPGFGALAGRRAASEETLIILVNRDDLNPQLLAVELLSRPS